MIECPATGSDEVEKVATPEPFRVPVPRVAAPSLNVTVPVGVPPAELTVAVNVTIWPKTEGWADEVSAVVVVAVLRSEKATELPPTAVAATA